MNPTAAMTHELSMSTKGTAMRKNVVFLISTILLAATSAFAQSAMSIGEAKMLVVKDAKPGAPRIMQAPVYLETDGKAANGDPLQSFAFRVLYEPASAVQSVSVFRAGVIADAKPLFEATPLHNNTISYMGMFPPAGGNVHFKTNAGERNLIAVIELTLAPEVQDGAEISLSLDDKISTVANLGGTQEQSYAKGNLRIGRPVMSMVRPPAVENQ